MAQLCKGGRMVRERNNFNAKIEELTQRTQRRHREDGEKYRGNDNIQAERFVTPPLGGLGVKKTGAKPGRYSWQ